MINNLLNNNVLKIYVNAVSFLGFIAAYLYIFIHGSLNGNSWFTERISTPFVGDNHLIIVLAFGVFILIQTLLLVKHPFSWNEGLLKVVLEFVLWFCLNILFTSIGYDLVYHVTRVDWLWMEILPSVFFLTLVLSIGSIKQFLERYALLILFVAPYIIFWMSIGYPITLDYIPTQFYNSMEVNLIEIGFWTFTMVGWITAYLIIKKPLRLRGEVLSKKD
jgi:hypothetical protein